MRFSMFFLQERFQRPAFSPADERPKKMICYLTNAASKREGIGRFTAENVDPFLCTHVIVSSAILHASNNSISFPDEDNLLESRTSSSFSAIITKIG